MLNAMVLFHCRMFVANMKKNKKQIDCCYENIEKAKYVSRAKWICPECKKDVSILVVLMKQAIKGYESFF